MTKCLEVGEFDGFKSLSIESMDWDQVGDILGPMIAKEDTVLVLASIVLREMLGPTELGGLVVVASKMKPMSRW